MMMAQIQIDTALPDDLDRIEYVCAGWARDEVRRMLHASPEMSGRDVLDVLEAVLTQRASQLSE